MAAARIDDPNAVIEHKLYWARADGLNEARYLTGILNSKTLLERVTPLMALGLFGPRDFDKNVFSTPFATYDDTNADHIELVDAVADAEKVAAAAVVGTPFTKARSDVRDALVADGVAARIEKVVSRILPKPI